MIFMMPCSVRPWTDLEQPSQLCLMQGKKSVDLDLDRKEDKLALQRLIEGADVVIQGYRPETFEKRGLGVEFALQVACRRGKGICWLVSTIDDYKPTQ